MHQTFEEVLKMKEDGVPNVWVVLAEKYGKSKDALRSWFNRERQKRDAYGVLLDSEPEDEDGGTPVADKQFEAEKQTSFDDDGNVKSITSKRLIEMNDEQEKDPRFVLVAHGFDPDEWTVVSLINNFWQGLQKGGKETTTLYQSKLSVKPKSESRLITYEDIDKYFELYQPQQTSVQSPTVIHNKKEGYTLEINLADVHIGNDAVTFEQLRSRMNVLLSDIKLRFKKYDFKKIILVQIGDVLHFDTFEKTTTSGTKVGTKSTFYEMFDEGARLLTWFIEELQTLCPVEFLSVNGNHDRVSGYAITKVLEAHFRENANVTFDSSHQNRKYRVIGNTLVGWQHGDMNYKNLKNILQTEARVEYGNTRYAEMHVGHLHHEMTKDEGSVIIRLLSSITMPDDWHKRMGYVGARQGVMSFVWDDETGLKEVWYSGVI